MMNLIVRDCTRQWAKGRVTVINRKGPEAPSGARYAIVRAVFERLRQ